MLVKGGVWFGVQGSDFNLGSVCVCVCERVADIADISFGPLCYECGVLCVCA